MTAVAESSSFYSTREHSTRTRTIFGKGGPISVPDQIFRDRSVKFQDFSIVVPDFSTFFVVWLVVLSTIYVQMEKQGKLDIRWM